MVRISAVPASAALHPQQSIVSRSFLPPHTQFVSSYAIALPFVFPVLFLACRNSPVTFSPKPAIKKPAVVTAPKGVAFFLTYPANNLPIAEHRTAEPADGNDGQNNGLRHGRIPQVEATNPASASGVRTSNASNAACKITVVIGWLFGWLLEGENVGEPVAGAAW